MKLPVLFLIAAGAALSQSFDAADLHLSPPADQVKDSKHLTVAGFVAADRYVIHRATLVDLIARAYNVDADKVLGGPPWVDYNRYEIDAKVKPGASEAALRTMLKSLLAGRFGLALKPDVQKAPGLILSLGKGNPGYTAATSDSGQSGCQQVPGTPRQGYGELKCANADMDTLAASMRRLASTTPGQPLPIANQTGLEGTWDIDLKWDLKMIQVTANMSTSSNELIFDAINKMGLKLDHGDVPQPVLSIVKATGQPTPNAANIATLLPVLPVPEFDVASVKACDSDPGTGQGRATFGPGGTVTANCVPIFGLIDQAWGLKPVDPQAVLPDGLGNRRPLPLLQIRAKTPAGMAPTQDAVGQLIAPMLQALLIDRLKITFHTETRPLDAPVLTAVKPKMTRTEDPATERKGCNREPVSANQTAKIVCRNMTMADLAQQWTAFDYSSNFPALDKTGLEGSWDFTITYNTMAQLNSQFPGRFGGGAAAADGQAPDPDMGLTLNDAIEKELGLKVKTEKREMPVLIFDHVETMPTDQ
ncbi:MAG TPA: TIGR03435 family protein [Bryobacteraceae bacterium]|jgi:uncharacterized protein (TIGR03435 family)